MPQPHCCIIFGNKISLTLLSGMEFPTFINWTGPFPFLGLYGGTFHFYSFFKRNFSKKTVENLIRRRILPMSHKKDARLYPLNGLNYSLTIKRVGNFFCPQSLIIIFLGRN